MIISGDTAYWEKTYLSSNPYANFVWVKYSWMNGKLMRLVARPK